MAILNDASSVRAWEETVVIPTYPVPEPDRNPMFLDRRVYQGSSGKVYPNPFTDRVSDTKVDRSWRAIFLENQYVRLMILPEIGGRIHIGQDKTNGYDFFYRQHVIKPALVGLLGPWISGGVEFNWPQHHRPSTYMPVRHSIEQHSDGSCTVWLSEHEPMNRMEGTVGICLHPAKMLVEARVRLYNRTPFMQTFLWWANAGIHVHDQYQAFFPPDVEFVADHARRAMSWYPIARNSYYGVQYDGGDISWYKNIPVPTSYMVTRSDYDFFGGYDHAKRAGVVHVANRHIAPGKKLWTWGNAEFGYAWDRELTDSDGPYIELMAGVFTDNQPDFSWLRPYETRAFSQFWYPIQEIGPVQNANRRIAVSLHRDGDAWRIGICGTEILDDLTISLSLGGRELFRCAGRVRPGEPFLTTVPIRADTHETDLLLRVLDAGCHELIRYRPPTRNATQLPAPAAEPPEPARAATVEELYFAGLHLEQYRHATREPEPWWTEALRRDPGDVRTNNAMGLLLLRRGRFEKAAEHFRITIARLTRHNANPSDGEPFYHLGLALKYQDRLEDAYAAFYKAAWNGPWQSAANYMLATIDCLRGDLETALEHLNDDHPKARNLKTTILRHLNRAHLAEPAPQEIDAQTCLDLAFDYAEAGFRADARRLIESFLAHAPAHPMLLYASALFLEKSGDPDAASRLYGAAQKAPPDYCFPSRLEEMLVLEAALRHDPADARAHYYLGNLLYDKHRREEAIEHWEASCRLDPDFSVPWRNLGIAYFNVRHQPDRALECYEQARRANPADARLLYELDQLHKRTGASPESRLARLNAHRDLVAGRDDLTVELITGLNLTGRHTEALSILASRRFHPWEGGEGLVSGQFIAAHLLLGFEALNRGDTASALEHFEAGRHYPQNLGEGKHLLTRETHLHYFRGLALRQAGRDSEAVAAWREAAATPDEATLFAYYRALALQELGSDDNATGLLRRLHRFAEEQMNAEVRIDYFATSLPNFLLFDDDLRKRNKTECLFLRGIARLGLGCRSEGAADLREVLNLDQSHLFARLELDRMRSGQTARQALDAGAAPLEC